MEGVYVSAVRETVRNGLQHYRRFRVVGYVSRKFKEESDVAAESHVHVTSISPLQNGATDFQRLDVIEREMLVVERRVRGRRVIAETMGEAIVRLDREDAAAARANPGVEAIAPQAADAGDWEGADDPLALYNGFFISLEENVG